VIGSWAAPGLLRARCTTTSPTRAAPLTVLTVNLNHFRLLRVVGKGAFGKVRIVERKDTGLTFALKYIRKDESQSHVSRGHRQGTPGSGTRC
jgi:serine/threonine protein kinase